MAGSDPPTYTEAYEKFRLAIREVLVKAGSTTLLADETLDRLGDAIGDIASAAFYDEGGQRHPGRPEPEPEGPPVPLVAHRDDPLYATAVAYYEATDVIRESGHERRGSLADDIARLIERADQLRVRGDREARDRAELESGVTQLLDRFGFAKPTIMSGLERALVEGRQYREAHAHSQQLRDHYTKALGDLLAAVSDDPLHEAYLHHVSTDAVATAREALANPPAWDGQLRP